MSDNTPDKNQNEEVDLGQLFNAIGRLFEKLFSFIGRVLKGLFSSIIYLLKPVVNHFKLISIVVMAAAVLGFVADYFKKPVYTSDMLVKPYFESKYELANNIDYFNSLVESANHMELSRIFGIDSTRASELISFDLEIGPETQNDLIKEYDEYIKSLDSTLAVEVTYDDFIDNRDILAGSIFRIRAKAFSRDIFPNLKEGFVRTFKNDYSIRLKERTDSIRNVKRLSYLEELERAENLQEIYLEIKKNESDKGEVKIGVDGFIPLLQEKTETKEFELFQEEVRIRNALRVLEENAIEESEYYEILSSFEIVGASESGLLERYLLLFPILALSIMTAAFAIIKGFRFIRDYD